MLVIRTFRLIRVFRIFKLFNFLDEGNLLLHSLTYSSRKIIVFFLFVLILVISIGTLMYMIEGQRPGTAFDNIPNSIYWAIVTMTTVGYGDITPETPLGRFLSAMMKEHRRRQVLKCPHCGRDGHEEGAAYCKYCGGKLE